MNVRCSSREARPDGGPSGITFVPLGWLVSAMMVLCPNFADCTDSFNLDNYDLMLPTRVTNYGGNHPFERFLLNEEFESSFDDDGLRERLDYDYEVKPEPLRIHFVTDKLEARKGDDDLVDQHIDFLIEDTLPRVAKIWSEHLYVYRTTESIDIDSDYCFNNFRDLPERILDDGIDGADLVILVSAEDELQSPENDGTTMPVCGPRSLALASPCALDQFDRPIVGFINFCLPLYALVREDGQITQKARNSPYTVRQADNVVAIALHEVAHILAMDSYLFKFFRDPTTGEPLTKRPFESRTVRCSDGVYRHLRFPDQNTLKSGVNIDGMPYFDVVTPTVATVVRNHFNCQELQGARLETYVRGGFCVSSHWDERVFLSELMSPVFSFWLDIISPLTLALMKDSGWYPEVSFENATISPYGRGMGCDFVNEPCIVDNEIPDHGKGIFCDTPRQFDGNDDRVCDPTHMVHATCNLLDLQEDLPEEEEERLPKDPILYFSDQELIVTFPHADYCPMPITDVGLDCTAEGSVIMGTFDVERIGSKSRCVNIEIEGSSNSVRPACMEVSCQGGKVHLGHDDFQVTCEYDYETVRMDSASASFLVECPRFATVCSAHVCPLDCSGMGVCNYDFHPARCECFDEDDYSADCDGSLLPPSVEPSSTVDPEPLPETPSPSEVPSIQEHSTPINAPSPIAPQDLLQPHVHMSRVTSSPSQTADAQSAQPTQEEVESLSDELPPFSEVESTSTASRNSRYFIVVLIALGMAFIAT